MKQWFTAAAVALGIGSALTGWAQGPGNHVGLKVGATRTALDGVYNLKSDYKTGYSGGLVLRCRISKPVAIQPELLLAQYGAHNQYVFGLVNPDPEYNTNLTYLVLPVLCKIYIGGLFNVQFGPQFGALVWATEVGRKANGENLDMAVNEKYAAVDYGLCGGLGIDLPNGLFADVRLNYGLADINNNDSYAKNPIGGRGFELHNRGFAFSVGYLINTAKDTKF